MAISSNHSSWKTPLVSKIYMNHSTKEMNHISQLSTGRNRGNSNKDKKTIVEYTNYILRKIDTKLDGLLDKDTQFYPDIAIQLIEIVCQDFDAFNNKARE